MLRAIDVERAGTWQGPVVDSVVLDYDGRHRRRRVLRGENGFEFLLDLAQAMVLAGGDGLVLEDGRRVRVEAAPERLLEITCADPAELARVAWHLGNRHLPTEITGARLLIRHDPVIADLLRGLGACLTVIQAPFNPEGGAYGGAHAARHGHGHDHG